MGTRVLGYPNLVNHTLEPNANGDVLTPADIQRLKAHTGCPAVMVGRGAIGNPWIFSRLERLQVPPEQAQDVILRHLALSLEHYGPQRGLVLFRKHASRYLSPYPLPGELRQRLLTTVDVPAFLGLLDQILEQDNLLREPQMHTDEHRYGIGQQ